jgi:hypothetical protein
MLDSLPQMEHLAWQIPAEVVVVVGSLDLALPEAQAS